MGEGEEGESEARRASGRSTRSEPEWIRIRTRGGPLSAQAAPAQDHPGEASNCRHSGSGQSLSRSC